MEAKNNRNGDYLNHISYFNDGAEKEIRLNNLQNWFMKKVSKYRNTMLCIEYMEYKRTAFLIFCWRFCWHTDFCCGYFRKYISAA